MREVRCAPRLLSMPRLGGARAGGSWVVLAVAVLLMLGARVSTALADTTITVNTPIEELTPHDGLCSLDEADLFINGSSEPDCAAGLVSGASTVIVPAGCYVFTGIFRFVGTTTMQGAGPGPPGCNGGGTVIREQAAAQPVFNTNGATTTITGLTLTGGHPSCQSQGDVQCNGGGIRNMGTLTVRNVLITGNSTGAAFDSTTEGGKGGGIYSAFDALTVENSTITGNSAGHGTFPGGPGADGGGIYNDEGDLTLINSVVSGNSAGDGAAGPPGATGGDGGAGGSGGGIFNRMDSRLVVQGSTISGNHAGAGGAGGDGASGGGLGGQGGDGGGVFQGQLATISDSTISGNLAGNGGTGGAGGGSTGGHGGTAGNGGGTDTQGPSTTMTNVTLTGNVAGQAGVGGTGIPHGVDAIGGQGGAIFAGNATTIRNVTIAGNTASGFGGGVLVSGNVTEAASIIAQNGPQNCEPSPTDGGGNVVFGDHTCPGTQADPILGPLASNGGPSQTMALLAGSAAIDVAGTAGCPAADERGVARPEGPRCDAGAYEFAPPGIAGATAAATGATTATVSAGVVANLRDTTVLVRYGRTTTYGLTTAGVDAGSGNEQGQVNLQLTGLSPNTAYHAQLVATNGDGTSASGDLTFMTPPSGPSGVVPILSGLRQSANRWAQGSALASLSRTKALPIGTTFSFTLNEPASLGFSFSQTLPGRLVHHRCVAPTRSRARLRHCSRSLTGGSLALAGHAGANKVRFYGRLTRRRRLKPGRWTVVVVARTPSGLSSAPHRLSFTIVADRRR
jgi:hypothetical protein